MLAITLPSQFSILRWSDLRLMSLGWSWSWLVLVSRTDTKPYIECVNKGSEEIPVSLILNTREVQSSVYLLSRLVDVSSLSQTNFTSELHHQCHVKSLLTPTKASNFDFFASRLNIIHEDHQRIRWIEELVLSCFLAMRGFLCVMKVLCLHYSWHITAPSLPPDILIGRVFLFTGTELGGAVSERNCKCSMFTVSSWEGWMFDSDSHHLILSGSDHFNNNSWTLISSQLILIGKHVLISHHQPGRHVRSWH